MKIIFLDIDGVMNSEVYHKYLDTKKKGWRRFNPEAVKMITKLVEEFNVKIVISSLWRFVAKKELATENLAESIALARDCDFLFITYNPIEMGIKKDKNIDYNESHFIVKLDTTRHTRFKKQFLLKMNDDGNFIEIATEYDNEYLNSVLEKQEELIF